MAVWIVIILLAVIKIPLLAFMLWLPFRDDAAAANQTPDDSSDDDGGTKTRPGGPHDRHPRSPHTNGPYWPRRPGHGGGPLPSPDRIRSPLVRVRRVRSC